MDRRLGLALSLSALLIGGATVFRVTRASSIAPNLTFVSTSTGSTSDTVDAAALLASIPPAPKTATPTTDTGIVSEQLFSDYLNLAMSGQATDDNLAKLADTYAGTITSLDKTQRITSVDLKIVPDSKESFSAYATGLTTVYAKYQTQLGDKLGDGSVVSSVGSALSTFSEALADIYADEAGELKALPVPVSVSSAHLRLVNNYLSNAAAFTALAHVDTDPADAYAAIVQKQKNGDEEKQIIADIEKILTDNGL